MVYYTNSLYTIIYIMFTIVWYYEIYLHRIYFIVLLFFDGNFKIQKVHKKIYPALLIYNMVIIDIRHNMSRLGKVIHTI